MWSDLVFRLRALVQRRAVEREMDEELTFYFERQVEKYVASGLSRAEAERHVRAEFGAVESVKEECREAWGVRWIETLGQDVRYALRMWRRNPGFTAVAALSLALGIGANTAIFSVLDEVLLRSLPVKNPRELALVSMTSTSRIAREFFGGDVAISYRLFRSLRDSNSVFSGLLAACDPLPADLQAQGRTNAAAPPQVLVQPVSGTYFSVLGVEPILGRVSTADDDRVTGSGGADGPVVVISYRFWQRRFALDPAVLGSSIRLNGGRFTIVGVARPGFDGESVGRVTDAWVPVALIAALSPQLSPDRYLPNFTVIGRLKRGVTRQQAQESLQAIVQRANEDSLYGISAADLKILIADGSKGVSNLRAQLSVILITLMSGVGLVLLIACANVATLLLARAAARRREIAVRLSIGASRARLIRQLLTESLLIAGAGGLVGVFLARWGAAVLVALISGDSPDALAGVVPDAHILGFASTVTVAAALLFGLAPAMQATRVDLNEAMNDSSRGSQGRRGRRAGRLLTALQVAMSVVLLIGASLFVRTLRNLESLDIGFSREHTLLINFDFGADYRGAKLASVSGDLQRRIRALPGVLSTAAATTTPFGSNFAGSPVQVPGHVTRPDDPIFGEWNLVGVDFFRTAGLHMIFGREFDAHDMDRRAELPEGVAGPGFVAVVNESFAKRFFAGRNPVGRHFTMRRSDDIEIVGVAKDVAYENLRKQAQPMVYLPAEQDLFHWRDLGLVVRYTGSASEAEPLIGVIRSEVSRAATGVRISAIQTLQNLVDKSLLEERLAANLSSVAGFLALLLVSLGLYGAVAYAVARRTQELGIRMALGAHREDIFWMVLGETLVTVAAGITVGVPLGLAAVQVLSAKLFGVSVGDPISLAAAILLMISVAALASYLPARRAAKLDPLTALRHE